MMKKYIKIVEYGAKPMTRGEAFSQGYDISSDDRVSGNDGYEVTDCNNVATWIPGDVFEKEYKCMDTALDRIVFEQEELSKKMCEINETLLTSNYHNINTALLTAQLYEMRKYRQVLNIRYKRMLSKSVERLDLSFGTILPIIAKGYVVRRSSWKEGMYLVRQISTTLLSAISDAKGDKIRRFANHCILVDKEQDNVSVWEPTMADIVADDWEVV